MNTSKTTPPNVIFLKKQAKSLCKKIRNAKDLSIAYEIEQFRRLREYVGRSDDEILSNPPKLTDCQHVIAKEFLFSSWAELIQEFPKEELFMKNVLKKAKTLIYEGLNTPSLLRKSEDFQSSRSELLQAHTIKEFRWCHKWLSKCKKVKTPNKKIGSSYTLKHHVEYWTKQRKMRIYVGNGAFIAAVMHMGVPYISYPDSPNIHVAISSKCNHSKLTLPPY